MVKQIIKVLKPLHRGLRVRLIVYGQPVERKAAHFGMIGVIGQVIVSETEIHLVRLCRRRVHLTTVL